MNDIERSLATLRAAHDQLLAAAAAVVRAIEREALRAMRPAGEINDADPARRPCPVRIVAIQTIVAEHYGVTRDRMLSRSRLSEVVLPRHVAMVLCSEIVPFPDTRIACWFNRDHGAVAWARRTIQARCDTKATFAAELSAIRATITSAVANEAAIRSAIAGALANGPAAA